MEDAGSNLRLLGRESLELTGVTEVQSYDEEEVRLATREGKLLIRGGGLHMERLDPEKGQVALRGRVDSLEYQSEAGAAGGFFSRVFR